MQHGCSHGSKEKSSSDKSDELLNMLEDIFEAFNLTYLSQVDWDGVGTFSFSRQTGKAKERLSRLHRAITLCLS
jgi:hypothetical protein